MMKFVKISGVIYDFTDYRLNLSNLARSLNEEIENSITRLGFVKQRENLFYNKKFDLLLKISIRNKSKLKFV